MKNAHLIDACPYIYRAYYSLPHSLKDPLGQQNNAVIGFANFLVKYIKKEEPTHMALCFDGARSKNFRKEKYQDYKSHRSVMPEEFVSQIHRCRQLSDALGLESFTHEAYEADDLIATLAKSLDRAGNSCTVVSNDKDLYQLVTNDQESPRIEMYDYAKQKRYDENGVRKKLGVMPSQVPDYLAIAGDSADNIPGVHGLGPRAAICLLANFSGLEEIYDKLDQVSQLPIRGSKRIAEKLVAQREKAFLSRHLATVSCVAELNPIKSEPHAKHELQELLLKLGLTKKGYAFNQLCQGSAHHMPPSPVSQLRG